MLGELALLANARLSSLVLLQVNAMRSFELSHAVLSQDGVDILAAEMRVSPRGNDFN